MKRHNLLENLKHVMALCGTLALNALVLLLLTQALSLLLGSSRT